MALLLDNVLDALGVRHTRYFSGVLGRECPYPDSLWALTRMLDRYKVAHNSLRIADKRHLTRLPVPFVAESGRKCVVVTAANDSSVTFRGAKGSKTLPLGEFTEAWSGAAVLLQADEDSREPDYRANRKAQFVGRAETAVAIVAAATVLLLGTLWPVADLTAFALSALCAIGLGLSWMLFESHIGAESRSAERLCSLFGGRKSCGAGTKLLLFRRYDLSELGVAYFGVNLLLSLSSNSTFAPSLAVITAAVIPFTLWSIGYQWLGQRRWCPLCVLVQVTVWLQAAMYLIAGTFARVAPGAELFTHAATALCGYMAALYLIHRLRETLIRSRKDSGKADEANRLRYDSAVWGALYGRAPLRSAASGNSILRFGGDDESKPVVTILSNPLCGPCGRMHRRVERLIDAGFTVEYVYSYFDKRFDNINRQILECYMSEGPDATWKRLTHWYSHDPSPDKTFFDAGAAADRAAVDAELLRHEKWVEDTGIRSTPYVLVDGRELPPRYDVEDLIYLY